MEQNLFERNLYEETVKLQAYGGGPISASELNERFFDGKEEFPSHIQSYVPEKDKKNAVVLIGPSCVGKSTYARNFIKMYPEFEYLSMDDCALKELKRTNIIFCFGNDLWSNTLGNKEFGERIERGRNLIIDGGWLHINSRSALLKTLKHYGYNVCACIFDNITIEEHARNVEARVLGHLAFEMLKSQQEFCDKDWIVVYQEENKLSREKAIEILRSSPDYQNKMIQEINILLEEKNDSGYLMQIESGLILAGFDSFMVV